MSGRIDEETNPEDGYPIYVEAGEVITINANCVGDTLDTWLDLYGPNGFYKSDDDDGRDYWECKLDGSHYSSGIRFTAPVSGVYTIVVRSYPIHYNYGGYETETGNYTLVIKGNFTAQFFYNADGRLNNGHGDLQAVLYRSTDDAGNARD